MLRLFQKKSSQKPEWLQRYMGQSFKPDKNLNIDEMTFCVLDCETTGLKKQDQIITVGAILVHGHHIHLTDILDQRYNVQKGSAAAEVHGEIETSVPAFDPAEHLKELFGFIDTHILVGHHIAFDLSKINQMMGRVYPGSKLKNIVLDTGTLIKRLDPIKYERAVAGSESLQLDALCRVYNIPVENRHTALGDAYMTALLLQRILEGLKKRGVKTAGTLLG